MKSRKIVTRNAARLLCGAAVSAIAVSAASAQSLEGEEIVVTAQRQEESLQDVPIAVSAFGGEDLQDRQLESFQDIQFNIPNFAFSRTQFTGSAISIRGVGSLAVGASTEPSTSIHLNDFFLSAPRLFETEFFDVERLEILRGPQGTLFGRNATGGVVNVITAKASPDALSGYADAEYGTFNSVKAQGALNVPLTESLAVRLAGTIIRRDGFTENLFDNRDIDDRDIYALRASARWLPTESTTIDFTASYMREDDNRSRYQKQGCTEGPLSPLLGCDPNGPLEFGRQDLRGTFFANVSAQTFAAQAASASSPGNPLPAIAGAYGLFNINTPQLGAAPPQDLRTVNVDTAPKYDAEESIFMVNAKHDFENFSVKFTGGYGNSKIATRTDFDGGVGPALTVPAIVCAPTAAGGLPAVCNLTGGPGGNSFPLSTFDVGITNSDGRVGVIGGNIQSRSSNFQATDLSIGETDYWSAELILTSDLDGRFNFLVGASRAESNGFADYGVNTTGLDYFAYTAGTLAAARGAFIQGCVAGGGTSATCAAVPSTAPAGAQAIGNGAAAGAATQGFGFYAPYFFNDSEDVFLESTSVFGEIYFDITDTLKLTGGVRHNWDTKGSRERETLLTSTSNAGAFGVVPFGTPSVQAILDANPLVGCTTPGPVTEPAACPGDPTGGVQDYRVLEGDFNSTTGRAVLQWTPTDDIQIYASWTRGFKPGGFNPATTATAVSQTFDAEVIKAYEAGIKSTLLDGRLQANFTGFYYDYSDLQVSRIVNNTSINDNIDATVWGLEGEFVLRATERLTMNMNASYLSTEIGEFSTFDARNPTAGQANVELASNLSDSLDCVVTRTGPTPLFITNGGAPTGVAAIDALRGGLGGVPGVGVFSNCSALAANIATINALIPGQGYAVLGGIDQDLQGNELPGAPEFKIAGGIQYEMSIGENYTLTPRVDAFYQTDFFWNIFNTQQDRIDGYAYFNAQIKLAPNNAPWSFRVFAQNLTNEDAITGAFAAGQGAGNFTNLFLLEPRRFGVGFNLNF